MLVIVIAMTRAWCSSALVTDVTDRTDDLKWMVTVGPAGNRCAHYAL